MGCQGYNPLKCDGFQPSHVITAESGSPKFLQGPVSVAVLCLLAKCSAEAPHFIH